MPYYPDERITYEKAETLVKDFIQECEGKTLYLVSAREVCKKVGIDPSNHNQRRVHDVLQEELEKSEEWSGSKKRYIVK